MTARAMGRKARGDTAARLGAHRGGLRVPHVDRPRRGCSRAEDPKAAARAIGNAGTAAARAIARDSSNAADVPGYAGTNLPERSIGANALEDEGRARLADPDDPGGAAGRAVVEGVTSRPSSGRVAAERSGGATRGKAVAASPQSSAHGADGLASGSASGCGAELEDAQDGGSAAGRCATASEPAARR